MINNISEFNYIILRYFNVAGADNKKRSGQMSKQSTHLIKILSEVRVGKKDLIEIFGNDYSTNDGTAIRDYIHVSDLANIHIETAKYLLNNNESNIFNCGYGKGYSVQEVIDCAKKLYKNKNNFKYSKRRKGDVEKLIAETSKIKSHLNWKPEFDNLEIILKSSVDWEKKLNEKNS